MNLTKIYCNKPETFPTIYFNEGLNVILAEIRDPENLDRDTHNLGKTTLAALIDFCLLKGKHNDFFLFKHFSKFNSFIFFLEVQSASRFITIRRSVDEHSKISFKYSIDKDEDFTNLHEDGWDHWRVPFEKSRLLLDSELQFSVAKKWNYRSPLSYALRLQDDYRDVFQLSKHRGKHRDWKPFLAELIGLNGDLVQKSYDIAAELESKAQTIKSIESQLSGISASPDKLEGMIKLQSKQVDQLNEQINSFNFVIPDKEVSEQLVEKIEASIAALNQRRYHLDMSLKMIDKTLGKSIKFDLSSIEKIFNDVKVYFGDQIKHDYDELKQFLTTITQERDEHLLNEKTEIETELENVEKELKEYNSQRMKALETIQQVDTFNKYRAHTGRLVDEKTSLEILIRQREQMQILSTLHKEFNSLQQQRAESEEAVKENIIIEGAGGIYNNIRLKFGEFVKDVIDSFAILSCRLNNEGNIEFSAEIIDESGTATSADLGYTYKKLLCVAFDIAVFSSYLEEQFVHFVYHDGLFESLDDRKKYRLLTELREHCELGLQQIITVIDSDLPIDSSGERMKFDEGEVVRLLHDQGDDGRLFKMPEW